MYKFIEPEVAGGFGDLTRLDTHTQPPIVHQLEYCFDGWLGDCLMETFPCFIMTEEAKTAVEKLELSGVIFDTAISSKSEIFEVLYPDKELPRIYWAKIIGKAGVNDFGLSVDYRLVISRNALATLLKHGLTHADITDYTASN